MKELVGRKVYRIVEVSVNKDLKVFGEIIKQTNFKTGNKLVVLKVEGLVTNATSNSVEIKLNKTTELGINSYNWYEKSWFDRFFITE